MENKDEKYLILEQYRIYSEAKEKFIERQFYDFFILRKNEIDINSIKFQESEVQAIKFCSISELRELMANNKLVKRDEVYSELENYIFKI